MNKPKIVVLCGSSRFVDVMAVCAWVIERDEQAIALGLHLLPQWYPDCPSDHLAEHEGCRAEMDELHLRKIDLADEIFVVNWQHYIGDSTKNEIEYAKREGKSIRWFTHDHVGDKVLNMALEPKICCICGQSIDDEFIVCPTCKRDVHVGCSDEFLFEQRCAECAASLKVEHA